MALNDPCTRYRDTTDRWGGFYEILSWALIMASATPYTYLPDKIPNHRKNEAFDDPACPPEWPKVADTVIEAGSRLL
jgi:hypothetical protein